MAKIGHSKLFWTTLVGKYWKSCKMAKSGQLENIGKLAKIAHSELFWTTLLGKMEKLQNSENWTTLVLWENIGKVAKKINLANSQNRPF